jgi:hypothetical protein
VIANRDIQRRLAAFARSEANRTGIPAAIDSRRFYAAMSSRLPSRPDQADAVDTVAASRRCDTPFLLRA